jgi:HEPN domain-containing protein
MNRAHSNLRRARVVQPGVYLEDLCFDAQQAAEKALKACLLAQTIDFPFTHDLARLITMVESVGNTVPDDVFERQHDLLALPLPPAIRAPQKRSRRRNTARRYGLPKL